MLVWQCRVLIDEIDGGIDLNCIKCNCSVILAGEWNNNGLRVIKNAPGNLLLSHIIIVIGWG